MKEIEKDFFDLPEIKLQYVSSESPEIRKRIRLSGDSFRYIQKIIGVESIPVQEYFIVLYLNTAYDVIGYYRHSIGGINSVIADVRLILSVALKSLATGIILSHNHPTGNLTPSAQDKSLTKSIEAAAKFFDILVLDHIIVTTNSYYSFSDEGLLGISQKSTSLTDEVSGYQSFDPEKLKALRQKAAKLKF